jgi:WD40 repeat protein
VLDEPIPPEDNRPFLLATSNTDPADTLFVGSDETDAIAAFDVAGNFVGFFDRFPGSDNPIDGTSSIVVGPNGNILTTSQNTNQVLEYDRGTGDFLGVFGEATQENSGLILPLGLGVGPDNNVYVTSRGTEQILKYDGLTGQFLGVFAEETTTEGQERFTFLNFGPDGNLYVGLNPLAGTTELGQGEVRVYDLATGQLLRTIEGIDFATGIAFDSDGLLYVGDDPDSLFRNTGQTTEETSEILIYDLNAAPGQELVNSFPVRVGDVGEMQFTPDGILIVANPASGTFTAYEPSTGTFLEATSVPTRIGKIGRNTDIAFFN